MHVNTMRLVVDALEAGSVAIPAAAAQRWQAEPDSLRLVRASSNFVFFFRRSGERLFLRFTHATERTRDEILAELDFVLHLSGQGVDVARPVYSATGELVEEVATKDGSFFAVAFEVAAGKPLDAEPMDEATVRSWGQALGRLHEAALSFPVESARARRSWETDVSTTLSLLAAESAEVRAALEASVVWLQSLPVGAADFGLIHFDFATDNVFWDGARCCAIDFDDAARYWYAADLAFALEPDPASEIVDCFVEGYRRERLLDPEWVEWLPAFSRFESQLKLARLTRSYAFTDPTDDHPWLAAMRKRHRKLLDELRISCL